ncbi:hypothetical protein OIU85_016350 [Salix viminalis]|uniref:Uncharacterized protein n=1 Tax=Salix viminalis TaxID=40686 RepID=A0A9Q0ZPL5_SALVM|nr:hypothetical protein OIU85_016350 [Salix viminalis]
MQAGYPHKCRIGSSNGVVADALARVSMGNTRADLAIGGFRSERAVSSGVAFFLKMTWKGPAEHCSSMQTEDQEDPKHAPLDFGRQFFKFFLCCVARTEDSVVRPL